MIRSERRDSSAEQARKSDLLRLMPHKGQHALDIGAREGYFSIAMADRFEKVTALDLTRPRIANPKVQCVSGNAVDLQFSSHSFDLVLCTEVLEHIPTKQLMNACREIERVASKDILIGVPYKQDIRVGRTTCYSCGTLNPPWGHVNSFDEQTLANLFTNCKIEELSYVGENRHHTNLLSVALMDVAGNPYGTYEQEEPCIHCGRALLLPPRRTPTQRIATKLAYWSQRTTAYLASARGNWIHMMLRKT
jgi:Methyltransferase domain